MKMLGGALLGLLLFVSNLVSAAAAAGSLVLLEPFPVLEGTISSVGDELIVMPDSISFGVSYGECLEHCTTTFVIQQGPLADEYLVTKEVKASDGTLELSETKTLAPVSWRLLTQRANFNQFSILKLKDPSKDVVTFGCPGCADGPVYTVSIKYGNGSTITFVYEDVQDIEIPNADLTHFKKYYLNPFLDLTAQIEKKF